MEGEEVLKNHEQYKLKAKSFDFSIFYFLTNILQFLKLFKNSNLYKKMAKNTKIKYCKYVRGCGENPKLVNFKNECENQKIQAIF